VGLDVGAIGSSSLFGFGSGWRFSIWLFVFNFNFKIKNPAAVVPAEVILFPHHRQYLTLYATLKRQIFQILKQK